MADDLSGEVWAATLDQLKLEMTRATFDTWLRGTHAQSGEGGEYVIGCQHAYAKDWLEGRLNTVILRALKRIVGGPVTVRYVVLTGAKAQTTAAEAVLRKAEPEDRPEVPALDEQGPILEAVREDRVSVTEAGALQWSDFYIKLKVAFRKRALGRLKGARLSVFLCLALHVDRDGIAKPGGIEAIMHETRYGRGAVCSALTELDSAGLLEKIRSHHGPDQYRILGYAWFGQRPAPALWETKRRGS